ncbi:hypothetical protein [Rhodococcus xishaensis]|uniref:Uncharacterized protein n=1 Tax=Rhodococcus xishaensis TaxID=2487364 RepID=A0A438AWH7_9NOCA|nr:hypothetical protein [Rhodococcus xishaensis]RVW03012.1 hypothetical protein EGT50_09895 [Rhodococcus xishaensis]
MARKAGHDNDGVEYTEGGRNHWAARGSRAYQNHKQDKPTAGRAVPAGGGIARAKTATLKD